MKAIIRWLFGEEKPDYRIGACLFCRGIGAIYLIAICSWWVQAELLVCENGLVPIAELLQFLDQRWEQGSGGGRWQLPTLFWITGASDPAIHLLLAAGALLSILIVLGIAQGPALIAVWVIYLSFVTTGDTFMSFQWDILLLESGFLAILLSAWRWRERWKEPPPITVRRRIALILVWFLAAKLMFLSGWVKLAWASDAQPEWWPDHTALTFHYMTQPIPTWTAFFLHQFPAWFHQISIWPMYFIELVLPFFLWLGFRFRAVAGAGFLLLMVLILLSGNYTYFNWLTIVLSLPLLENRFLPARWLGMRPRAAESGKPPRKEWVAAGIAAPVFLLLILLNFETLATNLNRAPKPLLKVDLSPEWLDSLAARVRPFYLCSGYGLFRTMTTDRPEIILQGSADGVEWKTYDFKWKPDLPEERPRFVAPHQPRVAWQLWFAALERRFHQRSRNSRWFQALLVKLLRGDETVQQLFRENPFPEQPPKVLRARLYLYDFTSISEWKKTGHWWKRTLAGEYLPEIRLQ